MNYQVQDNALERLKELLLRMRGGPRGEGSFPTSVGQPRQGPAWQSPLASMFSGWGTNNAAAGGGIYSDVGGNPFAGMSTNNAAANGGIYGGGGAQQPDLASMVPAPEQGMASPNIQALLAARQGGGGARPSPSYDTGAMDRMSEAIANPYREGPNENIGDDTRARALAWLAQQNLRGG